MLVPVVDLADRIPASDVRTVDQADLFWPDESDPENTIFPPAELLDALQSAEAAIKSAHRRPAQRGKQ